MRSSWRVIRPADHQHNRQCVLDKSNHLYAISGSVGKLYVFTVTPTSHSQASGSPYSVSKPVGLIVQPAPWY